MTWRHELTFPTVYGSNHAVAGRSDRQFHLHGFERNQHVAAAHAWSG